MRISPSTVLLLALFTTVAGAASDNPAPITIEADRLEMSQLDGRSVYYGNVELQQGDLVLQADRLEILQLEGQLQRAIADGKPARLRMLDEQTGQWIRGEASHMDYHLSQDRVEMQGNAVLWRGRDEFRGEYLNYSIGQRSVQARGQPETNGRVRIILQQDPEP